MSNRFDRFGRGCTFEFIAEMILGWWADKDFDPCDKCQTEPLLGLLTERLMRACDPCIQAIVDGLEVPDGA